MASGMRRTSTLAKALAKQDFQRHRQHRWGSIMSGGGKSKRKVARSARHVWSDAKQMITLRRELLAAEFQSDIVTAKRFSLLAASGCALSLCGAFMLVVMLAGLLDGWIDRSNVPWATLSIGALALFSGSVLLLAARSGFRREFLCFRESRAEIQEDLLWMREWIDDQLPEDGPESRTEEH